MEKPGDVTKKAEESVGEEGTVCFVFYRSQKREETFRKKFLICIKCNGQTATKLPVLSCK
jgi:hypothetical protein